MCPYSRGSEALLVLKGLAAVFSHVPMDRCQNLPELRKNGTEKRYCLGRPLMERYSSCLLQRHAEKTRKVKYALVIILYSPILTLIDVFFLKQQ